MEFEELKQGDPRWGYIKLGYGDGTIEEVGCTLTVIAMFLGIRPDVLNEMLKGTSYKDSAFAGDTQNLINWTKLEKYTNGLVKFHWRGWGYEADKVVTAIERRGACLVEVDFDGYGPKKGKHWILAKGNKKANDPYTGNEIPTNKYPIWTGWAEIEVNRKEDMGTELDACMADRKKFMGENGELYRALGVEKQSQALVEIERLKQVDTNYSEHECKICPEIPVIEPSERVRTGSKDFIRDSQGNIMSEITYKPGKSS